MKITVNNASHANQHLYSDVYPFEIVRKISDKTLEVRQMDSTLINSDMNDQKWRAASNENNPIIRIRLRKNGSWRDAEGLRYILSTEPSRYHDYSF